MNGLGNKADEERALCELGRQMALRDADPVTVLCCGASALCVVGAFSRRTLDVDAVAMIDADGEIVAVAEFSPEMNDAISAAGLSLALDRHWFNLAARAILVRGLPAGALERSALHSVDFGPCLSAFHGPDRPDSLENGCRPRSAGGPTGARTPSIRRKIPS